MKYSVRLFPLLLLTATLFSDSSRADWMDGSPRLTAQPSPVGADSQAQNPPSFQWPPVTVGTANQYMIELTAPDGTRNTYQAEANWFLPDHTLAPGHWSWRVKALPNGAWSDSRQFTLPPQAKPFVVPSSLELKRRVLAKAHPRGLPNGLSTADDWRRQAVSMRADALAQLQDRFGKDSALPSVADRDFPLDISGKIDWTKLGQIRKAYSSITRICQQAESAALLLRITGKPIYFEEAKRRGNELAALDPSGVTAHSKDDQTSRRIALTLALLVDQLWDDIDARARTAWIGAASERAEAIYSDLSAKGGHLAQYPYQSHAGVNLGYLAAISALLLGEQKSAERWFDFSVRQHFHHVWPYSGNEGGYANGTAYAQYAMHDALRIWPSLYNSTGINLFAKPWTEGLIDYFAWFLPPGTPTHMFGSDAESRPNTWLMKSIASDVATPTAKWYAKNMIGDEDPLLKLEAPYPLPIDTVPSAAPPNNAAWIRSIGWVAMHSNLADRGRTSVYFKSSPFGSYEHSHADQNSFVLVSAGRTLLSDSGVYDWYGSKHFTGWYRRTEAHNAVTYDSGQGQFSRDSAEGSIKASGRIVSAVLTPPLYRVEGDATTAYGGVFTKARRTLWYEPEQNVVVLRDQVGSPDVHTMEINFHAMVPFTPTPSGYRITNDGVTACIDVLSSRTNFSAKLTEGYPVPPDNNSKQPHYGLRLSTTQPIRNFDAWMAIRVGCTGDPIELISESNGTFSIRRAGTTLRLN